MNNHAKELLLDLLKLRVRYGEREFEQVAKVLKKGNDELLVNILKWMKELDATEEEPVKAEQQVQAEQPQPVKAAVQPQVEESITEIQEMAVIHQADPAKQELIDACIAVFQSKDSFPTVKQMREYVSQKIHLSAKKNTKSELIDKFRGYLSELPADEIRKEIELLNDKVQSGNEASSFLNMANAIVSSRKERRK